MLDSWVGALGPSGLGFECLTLTGATRLFGAFVVLLDHMKRIVRDEVAKYPDSRNNGHIHTAYQRYPRSLRTL